MSKVAVVGVGYVGLTQALGMCKLGHEVVAYDIDEQKIQKLSRGISTFFEPGLDELLSSLSSKNKIVFTTDKSKLQDKDFVFLCLPTPQGEDGSADTSHLLKAFSDVSSLLPKNCHVIIKSTVPVGSWKAIKKSTNRNDLFIVSNPEFLREGNALIDFEKPDRIVIGAETKNSCGLVASLYKDIDTEFLLTDNTSAELIKYAANSFLAMKLSFVNDIAALSENLEANSKDVLHGVGLDNRIGNKFLTPGPGWGGSCFPKDVRALANIADKEKIMMPLLTAAIESNENAQDRVVSKVLQFFNQNLKDKKIAILGLSFKANTDDVRNSPAVEIVRKLQKIDAKISAYDPAVKEIAEIFQTKTIDEAIEAADLLLILTEWPEFSEIHQDFLISKMKNPVILDTRKILDQSKFTSNKIIFIK
jgi:UDPglucose 6-dehydrogenase